MAIKKENMISGWWNGSIIAPMVFEGYCNSTLVGDWIEKMLLPELLPGQIVLIDIALRINVRTFIKLETESITYF